MPRRDGNSQGSKKRGRTIRGHRMHKKGKPERKIRNKRRHGKPEAIIIVL